MQANVTYYLYILVCSERQNKLSDNRRKERDEDVFDRYVSFVFATLFFVVIHHGAKATNSMAQPHNIASKTQKHPDVRSANVRV